MWRAGWPSLCACSPRPASISSPTRLRRAVQFYSIPQHHISDVTVTTAIDGADGLVTVAVEATGAEKGSIRLGEQSTPLSFRSGQAQAQLRVPAPASGRRTIPISTT